MALATNNRHWEGPNHDQEVKVNFDGAIFQDEWQAGLWVIIQDHQSTCCEALNSLIPQPLTVMDVKTLAALKAVKFAAQLGFRHVIFEGNSSLVIEGHQTSISDEGGHIGSPMRLLIGLHYKKNGIWRRTTFVIQTLHFVTLVFSLVCCGITFSTYLCFLAFVLGWLEESPSFHSSTFIGRCTHFQFSLIEYNLFS